MPAGDRYVNFGVPTTSDEGAYTREPQLEYILPSLCLKSTLLI